MDIDIQDTRREEVINYCIEKYGRDRVANIVTFGRMAARNSVRYVARVLQVPYAEADRLAKMIPPPIQGRHTPLIKSLAEIPELIEENQNPNSARVFDMATRLEGTIRSHGVHAAGVVIAPDDIVQFAPLEMAQKGVLATQYSMGPVEELGLLKMDFLGLSNLTIIKNALRIIRRVYGKNIDIDQIPLDDKKTLELFQRGETTGVFQFESAGMKRYLKQLKPTHFDDLVAMNALYRPGPMQWIEDFIARKNGIRRIEYMHPSMEPALKSTYGVIVYQEQVMQISKEVCGFTGGQADTMRKAIGKKIPEVMKKLKKDFVEGGVKTVGADRDLMERFWHQLEDFAAYCFNKSHAACYALIAYQTAYLKSNYPAAFMAALMTSDYDDTDRLAIEMTECKKMGIEVLLPDVNQSFHEFAVVPETNQIRFGLDAIKNVGHGAAEEIIKAREKAGGSFESIEDYCKHVNPQIANRKALESLIKAGAFDRYGDRGELLMNTDNILALASRLQKDSSLGQVDLFGNSVEKPKVNWNTRAPEFNQNDHLSWERELLGLYLSSHPLDKFLTILNEKTTPVKELSDDMEGRKATVGGSIVAAREITTKSGSKMSFVRIADTSGEIELVVFPKAYEDCADCLQRDNIIIATGKVSTGRDGNNNGEGELKILADDIKEIKHAEAESYVETGKTIKAPKSKTGKKTAADPEAILRQRLYIRVENSDDQPMLISLREMLDIYRGEVEVVLVAGPKDSRQIIKLPQTIMVNEESIRDIASIFGPTNVVVK
jgi:DNA polymerase-3 subunit alpha